MTTRVKCAACSDVLAAESAQALAAHGDWADILANNVGAAPVRPEDVHSQAAAQSVTGRFTRPDEVADLVLILASDRTADVTGADISIDGGLVPTW